MVCMISTKIKVQQHGEDMESRPGKGENVKDMRVSLILISIDLLIPVFYNLFIGIFSLLSEPFNKSGSVIPMRHRYL